MNKIIIIGHPDSGHTRIAELLYRCGLKKAKPSRSEGMTAPEVSRAICKGMCATDVDTVLEEGDLAQISPEPLWDRLILDLMLGNVDQDFWGWTDSQALLLLEHFGKLDDQIAFIFVYDDPASALRNFGQQHQPTHSEEYIHERLKNWEAYNSMLLRLFLRHSSQCLLLHANAVDSAKETFLSMVGARFATTLLVEEEAEATLNDLSTPPENEDHSIDTENLTEEAWKDMVAYTNAPASQNPGDFPAKDAERFIIESILDSNVSCRQVFDELQACANLPFTPPPRTATAPETAWKSLYNHRAIAFRSIMGMRQHIKDLTADLTERKESREQVEACRLELAESEIRAAGLLDKLLSAMQDLEDVSKEKESMAEENALLKKSLAGAETDNRRLIHERHKAHEELERVFLENRQQQQAVPTPPALLGAAERVKAHLSYRLGSLIVQRSKSIGGLVCLPFSLVEEKKRYNEERRSRVPEKLPPIQEYSDAHAAERIKGQLSYRLGSVVVRNSGSPGGWIRMPFAILSCVRAFHRQRTVKS